MPFEPVLEGLSAAGVRYVVIGGVAASIHGSARITLDIDVCYDSTPENRERLARVLNGWHAYLRGAEPGLPFILDARTLRDVHVLTLVTDVGSVDIMDRVAGVGEFPAVLEASVELTLHGRKTRILSLEALIASKRAAGRRKDQEALLELEALREIRQRRGLG